MKSRKLKLRILDYKCDGLMCKCDSLLYNGLRYKKLNSCDVSTIHDGGDMVCCTLIRGHSGKHIACSEIRHNVKIWS